jgi:hypothetical protein
VVSYNAYFLFSFISRVFFNLSILTTMVNNKIHEKSVGVIVSVQSVIVDRCSFKNADVKPLQLSRSNFWVTDN